MGRPIVLSERAPAPVQGDVLTWDGEGWIPEMMRSRWSVVEATRSPMAREVAEGPGLDVLRMTMGLRIGLGGDTVLLSDAGGEPIAEYAATGAGLEDALAAMGSGDFVRIPAAITIDRAITVPAGGTLRGPGKITASGNYSRLITVNGTLEYVEIDYTSTSTSGDAAAVYTNDGAQLIRNVIAVCQCDTGATPHGAQINKVLDSTHMRDCYFEGRMQGDNDDLKSYGLKVATPGSDDGKHYTIMNVIGFGYCQTGSDIIGYGIHIGGTEERCQIIGCYGVGQGQKGSGQGYGIVASKATLIACYGEGRGGGTDTWGIGITGGRAIACSGRGRSGDGFGIMVGQNGTAIACYCYSDGDTRYGIGAQGSSPTIIACECEGDDADFWVDLGVTAYVYAVQYNSTEIGLGGAISYLPGDRVSVDDLADTEVDAKRFAFCAGGGW